MASNQRDETIRLVFEATGDEQLAKIAGVLYDIKNAGGPAADAAGKLLDQMDKLASQSRAVDNLVALKAAAGETGIKLVEAQKGLADLNSTFDRTDTSSRAVNAAFAKAEQQVSSLTTQHNKLAAQVTTSTGALRAQGVDTEHLDQAHKSLQGSLAGAAQQAGKVAQEAKHAGDETKNAGEHAKESTTAFGFFKDKLAEIISIAAAVEIAIKGIEFGKEGIANAAALEAQLSRVKAAAQDAKVNFEGMEAAVEKAAEETNTSSQVAAQGLTALVNGGKSAKDAVDALVPTLQLAKIANIDVSQAADLVGKNLDAFNIPAKEAGRVVDLLTAASHGSATALSAIANAAAELAPDAKTLGIDFDHTAGLLGLLSDKGLNAGNSVRALRTIFQDLQNPASTLRGELLALGDGTGNLNTAVAFLTSGTPRANQALLTLSGTSRTVIELLGQAGPRALEKFTAEMEEQSGIAAKLSKIIDDNLRGAYTGFSNSVERIGSALAKPVLGPLQSELEKLTAELNKFAESPDFQDIQQEIGEIATEGTRALDNFLHGIDWKSFLNDAKSSLTGVVEDLRNVADSASTIAGAVNTTAAVIGTAYHGVAGAIDGVVGAAATAEDKVLGLGQRLYDSVGAGDKFRSSMEGVRAGVQSLADEALTNLDQHTTKLTNDLDDLAGGTDNAAAATTKHGDAAGKAAPQVNQHADATHAAAKATASAADGIRELPPLIVRAADEFNNLKGAELAHALAIRQSADGARLTKDQIETLVTAFSKLGVQSTAALNSAARDAKAYFDAIDKGSADTASGLIDRQNAFLAYAEKQLAATAGLDEGTKASARAQLEAKAATLGLTDALRILESQSSQTGNALLDQAKKAEEAATRSRVAADQASAAHFNAGVQANIAGQKAEQATDKAEKGFTEWGDAADKAALDTAKVTANTSHANEAMDQLTGGIANARAMFLATSPAAAQLYDTILKGQFDIGHSDDGAGFDRVARAMTVALEQVQKQVANDRVELSNMIDDVNNLGTAAGSTFGQTAEQLRGFAAQVAAGNYQVGLLGKQDLGPLQQALEAAAQRAEQLAEKSATARQRLADLDDELQDQIDGNNGNKEAQEDRRYKKQLEQIKETFEESGKADTARYNDLLAKAAKLHEDALNKIREEAEAKNNPDGKPNATRGNANSGGGLSFAGSGQPAPHSVVNIHIGGEEHGPFTAAPDVAQGVLDAIARAQRNSI